MVGQSPRSRVLARFGAASPQVQTRGVEAVYCAGAESAASAAGRAPSCVSGLDGAQVPQWGVSHKPR